MHTLTKTARPGLGACSGCCVPAQAAICLLRLLYACSGCCVPAQAAVCLLSLLCATIQPSLLCACLAFYVPQYSRAYCVPAQPSALITIQSLYSDTPHPGCPSALSRYNLVYYDTISQPSSVGSHPSSLFRWVPLIGTVTAGPNCPFLSPP